MSALDVAANVDRRRPDVRSDPGCVKTQTLILRVEFPPRFRRRGNQSHWEMLWQRAIEKTILSVLGSDAFSHSLDPNRTFALWHRMIAYKAGTLQVLHRREVADGAVFRGMCRLISSATRQFGRAELRRLVR
jgi:hypothetical protein